MDWTYLIGALAFVTLLTWIGIAYLAKRKTEARMDDPNARKSTLATDKDPHAKPADV
ncbi:MAG: hypothetical protein HKN30_09620 [Sulfitobacter sp.]|nr:hypothetical protein [Sulfitobacter sp.]